ncbi:hypothetical protein PILCRDRAFT_829392 [Piloderma croceum F 1598]|uniref:Uncharacterized protein n=1 Tax=Piloderma croceum (strain F 1598) TaxID=765440 RepID=A0A0C3EZE5_PILCF|nr:hypothetical protein PILCRDRAFT_829392 [Piloderma croceum F 1598]
MRQPIREALPSMCLGQLLRTPAHHTLKTPDTPCVTHNLPPLPFRPLLLHPPYHPRIPHPHHSSFRLHPQVPELTASNSRSQAAVRLLPITKYALCPIFTPGPEQAKSGSDRIPGSTDSIPKDMSNTPDITLFAEPAIASTCCSTRPRKLGI